MHVNAMRKQAARFIQEQFGPDASWMRLNEALWDLFAADPKAMVGLTRITEAVGSGQVDPMLSVLGLLTGPDDNCYLERVFYRIENREVVLVLPEEVRKALLSPADASSILVGWKIRADLQDGAW